MQAEGVIKFDLEHHSALLHSDAARAACDVLCGWRRLLVDAHLVGADPARYEGLGFGNVSLRLPPYPGERGRRRFLITGSQTGALASLRCADFCAVDAYDIGANHVASRGPIPPSSESLTHAAIYDLNPRIRAVFHVHAPALWQCPRRLGLPKTAPHVAYGTQEMAREMARLYREGSLADRQLVVMSGHTDGVLSFGRTADEAGTVVLEALARAYSLEVSGAGRERGAQQLR